MRKTVLILISAALSIAVCAAREIPREKAAAMAAEFFRSSSPSATGVQPASLRLVRETPSMYVFEKDGGGYVIASADDIAAPVLGYSLSDRFPAEDMPVNMKSMLDWFERVIAFAREKGWESNPSSSRSLPGADSGTEVRLQTARWGQSSPFNDLSPTIDGEKCPSGCVATAQAIIMKYYGYPERGTGVLPDYDYGWDSKTRQYRYHMKGYELGHTYDWADMPDDPKKGCTSYQAEQIARLLYDIAVMSEMDFAPGGSGASSFSPLKLMDYFGYDKSMYYAYRIAYSSSRWEQLIRNEIDAGRPVFHCGVADDGGGHAFVIDGYRDRYFSINYGWSGGSSWFLLSPIEGHERELTEFYDGQDMVVRIFPDAGGEPALNVMVPDSYLPFRWDFKEKSIEGGWFWLWDFSYNASGMIEIAYCLYDSHDRFKQLVSETVSMNTATDYVPEMPITLPDNIKDGDAILLARRVGDAWIPLPQSRQSCIRFDRSRPLSKMASLGHSFGSPDAYSASEKPVVFLDMYKDIWWSLTRVRDGHVVYTSKMDEQSIGGSKISVKMLDSEASLARFEFVLPEGTYRLLLRNFDEELTVEFTL